MSVNMSKFICLCIILFTGQQYVCGVLSTGYEYVPRAGTWLRLHITPDTWQSAMSRCQLEGGILASPSSQALAQAMLSLMAAYIKVNRPVFTGIHSLISNGDFMSLDAVPLEKIYLDWAQGEPDDHNADGNCLVLTPYGEMADVSCVSVHPYFCRKENATMRFNQQCGTTATGYEYFPVTGSCYKFHSRATTWHHAARACHAEGGYLAVINSDTEAKLFKDILRNNPANTVKGATLYDDEVIIGVLKWQLNNDERFRTIHGQTLKEAGYEKWAKNEPNNHGGKEFYGAIRRDASLNDIVDFKRGPYICEITP